MGNATSDRRRTRKHGRKGPSAAPPLLLATLLATTGCAGSEGAVSELAGFAAGSAVGVLTANPFVAVATGMAVRFGTGEAGDWLERRRQEKIHGAIARAAGAADADSISDWSIEIDIPPGRAHGQVQTTRSLGGRIACREVLYNVKSGGEARYFVGVICRHPDGQWRWAVSEPTRQRW